MLFRIFNRQSGPQSLNEPLDMIEALPPAYKEYTRFPSIALPPAQTIDATLGSLTQQRESRRDFDTARSIPLDSISNVLFTGFGIDKENLNKELVRRHHPSGGGLYPLECYVAAYRIDSVEGGIYHYNVRTHALEKMHGNAQEIHDACKGLVPEQDPAAIVIITSVWGRNYPKYGEFAYRLSLIEAGHAMQNLLLAATAKSLKACPIAGFRGDSIAKTLDVSKEAEDPLYLAFLGM